LSEDPSAGLLVLDRQQVLEEAAGVIRRLAPPLLREVGRPGWSLSVLLTDGPGIMAYNRQFKGRASPTDVLDYQGEGEDEEGRPCLGDLVISVEQAAEQAPEYGNTPEEELQVLLIHGVLHLTGMDHETDGGAMETRERELRRSLIGEGVG